MKITVINGTESKGATFQIKEHFLQPLRAGNDITEFYLPKDFSHFCTGCKSCFAKSELLCPHATETARIWNALQTADLIVFAYPVYVSGVPAQVKALLDHFACRHLVHRPDNSMFGKRAVLLTQSLRSSNKKAQKEVAGNLNWLGISDIKTVGFNLKDGYVWEALPAKCRGQIEKAAQKAGERYQFGKRVRTGIKVKMLFAIGKMSIQSGIKKSGKLSADAVYWRSQGWVA